MITKYMWLTLPFDRAVYSEYINYWKVLLAFILTPITVILDLKFLPLEIFKVMLDVIIEIVCEFK